MSLSQPHCCKLLESQSPKPFSPTAAEGHFLHRMAVSTLFLRYSPVQPSGPLRQDVRSVGYCGNAACRAAMWFCHNYSGTANHTSEQQRGACLQISLLLTCHLA